MTKSNLILLLVPLAFAGCSPVGFTDPMYQRQVADALRGKSAGKAASTEAAKSTSTGWATLKGVFKFDGSAPPTGEVSTAGKDAQVCGQQVPVQSLEVDRDSGGIANIVIFARSKVSRVFESGKKGQEHVFDQQHCLFLSHVMAVRTKVDTVLIKNSDPISHNTNLSPQGNEAINPLLPPKGEVSYKFNKQLVTPSEVTCSIHPWMKAYLLARDDPYFAVSAKNGSFEIANLPAGEDIEFQVWHEKAAGGGGLAAKPAWKSGRFKLKLTADKTEDLQTITVPSGAFQ
jgi:hypothetical protein